jgi:hypothetical protein
MPDTRRRFLQSGAGLAAGIAAHAQAAPQAAGKAAAPPAQASEIQVPKMKFFHAEISRLVLGCNPFYGFAHYNNNFSNCMREYYTPERVCEVMRRCASYGINAYNLYPKDRGLQDWARFQAEGGQMHAIIQVPSGVDIDMLSRTVKPLAMYLQGEAVDTAWQQGKMDTVKEWCKKARGLGTLVGVGSHIPEVIARVEEENWDVDFYAGCVYARRRTQAEWRKTLGGEIMEMPGDTYMQSDPPRMYQVLKQAKKPCFAFKILAAGRIPDNGVERAFRTAFESIKPNDGVFVGMFPKFIDEVGDNAAIVRRILTA